MEALSDFANYLTRGVQRRVEMMVAYKVEAKLDRYIPDGFSYTDAIKMRIAIYIAKGLVAPCFPLSSQCHFSHSLRTFFPLYTPPSHTRTPSRCRSLFTSPKAYHDNTDAIKMQIAIYIAKGLVAPYFPPEDAEQEAREAAEEARKAEEEARKRLEEEKRKKQEGEESSSFWSLFSWDDGEEEEEQKKEEKKEAESYLMSFFHKKVDEKSEAAKAEAERIAAARYAQKKAEAEDAAKEEEEEQGVLATISNFFSSN
ncbi:unnamed protein product [Closterium sp. Yama58-4]|nr:unnamed protein product [Closterium sp. Yama58-4]